MPKQRGPVNLLVGFSYIEPPHFRECNLTCQALGDPKIDGVIAFGIGLDKVSSGLVRFNKKSTKGKIYWDKKLDGYVSKQDELVGKITLEKSQAKHFSKVGDRRVHVVVDVITGKGVLGFVHTEDWENKFGNYNATLKIKTKTRFLEQGTLVKSFDEVSRIVNYKGSQIVKDAFNYRPDKYVDQVLGGVGYYLETELGWDYDSYNSVVLQSPKYFDLPPLPG